MIVAETDRLIVRWFASDDAPFVLELVNDPGWIRYIGDRGVRTTEAAQDYLQKGPLVSYTTHGFGLSKVERRDSGVPLGMCGLIRRDSLPDVDLGFAFLERFRAHGYAFEASQAVMAHGRKALGIGRIAAILSADNERSRHLLIKLGFRPDRTVRLADDAAELDYYVNDP